MSANNKITKQPLILNTTDEYILKIDNEYISLGNNIDFALNVLFKSFFAFNLEYPADSEFLFLIFENIIKTHTVTKIFDSEKRCHHINEIQKIIMDSGSYRHN
jgi:hypothetical protein